MSRIPNIKIEDKDTIVVFGSNLSGIHGAGAARFAREKKGAVLGVAEGLTGESYALPTVARNIAYTLNLADIYKAVLKFKSFSFNRPDLNFMVTRVGCGLAGHRDVDIAPMFKGSNPENCYFDTQWFHYLGDQFKYWGSK